MKYFANIENFILKLILLDCDFSSSLLSQINEIYLHYPMAKFVHNLKGKIGWKKACGKV